MEGLTAIVLAAPSPSPTPGLGDTPMGRAVEHPGFWIVVLLLIAFYAIIRAVGRGDDR